MSEQSERYERYLQALDILDPEERELVLEYVSAMRRECTVRRTRMRERTADQVIEGQLRKASITQKRLVGDVERLLEDVRTTHPSAEQAIWAHIRTCRTETANVRREAKEQDPTTITLTAEDVERFQKAAREMGLHNVDMSPKAILERIKAEIGREPNKPIEPGNGSVHAILAGLPGHGKRR